MSSPRRIADVLGMKRYVASAGTAPGARGPVRIYGGGSCGRDTLAALRKHGVTVESFLDARIPEGTVIDGLPVLRPDSPSIGPDARRRCCVVVAVFNGYTDAAAIVESLRRAGYADVVPFPVLYQHYAGDLGDRYWLAPTDHCDAHAAAIGEAHALWSDDASRRLFEAVLEFRRTLDLKALPAPEAGAQYFDAGLPRWPTPLSFVDCGSFDGDTLRSLRAHYGKVRNVVAFEPDLDNFRKLATAVRAPGAEPFAEQAILYPCGVWSATTQLRFASGGAAGSRLATDGADFIQCVSLDEVLHGIRPTLVKMDVEGAEPEALLGARATIARDRPALAVCVYHRPEHLWELPLLVHRWDLGYRLQLRSYGYSGFELVMYAVPPASGGAA